MICKKRKWKEEFQSNKCIEQTEGEKADINIGISPTNQS